MLWSENSLLLSCCSCTTLMLLTVLTVRQWWHELWSIRQSFIFETRLSSQDLLILVCVVFALHKRSKKMPKSSEKNALNGKLEFSNPAGIPRIPRANPNAGWQPTNLEMTDSGSRHALVTKDRTEDTTVRSVCRLFHSAGPKLGFTWCNRNAFCWFKPSIFQHVIWYGERLKRLNGLFQMWDYDYTDDARSYKSQTPSRTGYGAAGANNGPRESTRNPYYDAYDDRMRRY